MARPLKLSEIEAAFKKWHVPYTVTAGAATRSNSSNWGDKQSVTGCMYHHTAGDASDALELRVLTYGRTGLAGPLCNFGVGDDGHVYVVAVGSANHAGGGDPETLALVRSEKTPMSSEIKPNESASSPRSVGGNSRFYGWEVFYGIRNDPTVNPRQHRATVLSMAAIIDKIDEIDTANVWTGASVIGHREWTSNKPDPAGVKLYEVRKTINAIRKAGPAAAAVWLKTGSFTAPTTPPKEPTVAVINPVYKSPAVQDFMGSDAFPNPNFEDKANPFWSGASWHKYVGKYTRDTVLAVGRLEIQVAALKEQLEEIKALLTKETSA